jgi:hypothetical protein
MIRRSLRRAAGVLPPLPPGWCAAGANDDWPVVVELSAGLRVALCSSLAWPQSEQKRAAASPTNALQSHREQASDILRQLWASTMATARAAYALHLALSVNLRSAHPGQ